MHIFSLQLPANFADLAGAGPLPEDVKIVNSNDIKNQFVGGNITASDTLHMLNFLIERVYESSAGNAVSPYACEFSGLAKLDCGEPKKSPILLASGEPIRAVGLAGVFVPATWATGGKPLSLEEAEGFYTDKDFLDMKAAGLNTVQLEVPTAAFDPRDEQGDKMNALLKSMLEDISDAGLVAIINVVSTADELDAVVAAASFCNARRAVLAMSIPSKTMLDRQTVVDAIRTVAPKLPIFLPLNQGDLTKIPLWATGDKHLYGALDMSHTGSIPDIASSSSQEDRSKLFYHEATTCMARSPMEFASCFGNLPLFLASGFDLSVDNCILASSPDFADYGQCDRFDETTFSGFWERHRASFAARQVFAYEQGMGWSFATWKLYENDKVGTIDKVEKLLSLQDVIEAGLFPTLDGPVVALDACLNPPEIDFILGDDTLAPSMGPPPDCGNGWWNYTTSKCDYWIPPPPTAEPTAAPTEPCPACPEPSATQPAMLGAIVGGLVVGGIVWKLLGNKRRDYESIPN